MKGLRVELAGKGDDLFGIKRMRAAGEFLPDLEVIKIKPLLDVASFSVLESGLGRALPLDDAGWDIPAETLQEWLDKSAAVLSHAALGAVAVLDLPLVVIDGAMPPALRDALIAATAAEMARMRHHGITLPTLRAGTLGRRARALGAAALPLDEGFLPGGTFSAPRLLRVGHDPRETPMHSRGAS